MSIKVCIVSFALTNNDCSDEEFLRLAQLQGTIYSLEEFQHQFNEGPLEKIDNDTDYIRFIDVDESNRIVEKKRLGYISVDSGTVLLADPCYWIQEDKETELKPDETRWGKFISEIRGKTEHVFKHKSGFDGKGILIRNFGGDGCYPVYVETDGSGRQTRVIIDFE